MPTDLSQLTDAQRSAVMAATKPLPPTDRPAFLAQLAQELYGRELGDGAVYRAIRETQRRFFAPPEFSSDVGKDAR
jgi:hypothetical protein